MENLFKNPVPCSSKSSPKFETFRTKKRNLLIFPASSPGLQHLVPPKSEVLGNGNEPTGKTSFHSFYRAKPSQTRTVQVCRQRRQRCTGQRFLKKAVNLPKGGEGHLPAERTSVAAERARDLRENRIFFLSGDDPARMLSRGPCRMLFV